MLESKAPAQKLLRELIVCYFLAFLFFLAEPGYFYLIAVEFPLLGLAILSASGFLLWTSYRTIRYVLFGPAT